MLSKIVSSALYAHGHHHGGKGHKGGHKGGHHQHKPQWKKDWQWDQPSVWDNQWGDWGQWDNNWDNDWGQWNDWGSWDDWKSPSWDSWMDRKNEVVIDIDFDDIFSRFMDVRDRLQDEFKLFPNRVDCEDYALPWRRDNCYDLWAWQRPLKDDVDRESVDIEAVVEDVVDLTLNLRWDLEALVDYLRWDLTDAFWDLRWGDFGLDDIAALLRDLIENMRETVQDLREVGEDFEHDLFQPLFEKIEPVFTYMSTAAVEWQLLSTNIVSAASLSAASFVDNKYHDFCYWTKEDDAETIRELFPIQASLCSEQAQIAVSYAAFVLTLPALKSHKDYVKLMKYLGVEDSAARANEQASFALEFIN